MILLKLTGHFGRKMCVIVKCRSLFIYFYYQILFVKKPRNLSPFASVPEHFYGIVFIEEM